MQAFWRQLGDHACLESWPHETRQWVRLYSAIGLKRHEQTIYLAQAIINDSTSSPTPQLSFLMGATLSAQMKTGRYEQARQFAIQAIADADGRIRFPLYLKILFAQLDIVG